MGKTLNQLEDLSNETVAVTLGISLGTVKSRINRAKQQLRDLFVAAQGANQSSS